MNFLYAKKIVSPDSPVVPGSKEHKDILLLMRQSGRVFAEDNVLPVPKQMTTTRPLLDRPLVENDRKVSKKEFLSISANVSKEGSVSARNAYVFPKDAPTPGMSKKEWLQKMSSLIIENGQREEIQATGTVEGGTGESQGSA
jgi:hypothetical protein